MLVAAGQKSTWSICKLSGNVGSEKRFAQPAKSSKSNPEGREGNDIRFEQYDTFKATNVEGNTGRAIKLLLLTHPRNKRLGGNAASEPRTGL